MSVSELEALLDDRVLMVSAKIEGLKEKELVTSDHAVVLHETRLFGNEAVHELRQPQRQELRTAIEIAEHTLENIYEIATKARALRRSVRSK